ncbi:hypothetical protein ASZ90_016666 [hydrocarbon metagenome]|uniref:Uncharacterized protein n=1 Tax=hydrocarbon metagenome TaxID=938273 RepID=A0A0W8EKJ6_9ZZZZ
MQPRPSSRDLPPVTATAGDTPFTPAGYPQTVRSSGITTVPGYRAVSDALSGMVAPFP